MKLFLYARKSQEDEGKQIQSIDDQLKAMRQHAQALWHTIVEEFTESMSAKAPWRPVFGKVLEKLKQWKAEGIIAWKLDRLSRNPIDSWNIQYMLQTGELKVIVTSEKTFDVVDSGLIMSVLWGMSNQFLLDLSKNVKRGMNSKVEKGWKPWVAPEGYKNDFENRTIIPDPINFDKMRKIWDLMLTWNHCVPKIVEIANTELGFITRKKRKTGNKPLWISHLYNIFNNYFYTGDFYYKWVLKKGNHTPMITHAEFERVQMLLWSKAKMKIDKHDYPFSGLIKCGVCGSMITAGKKEKEMKPSWQLKIYRYYWCTRKKKDVCSKCKEKAITIWKMEEQVEQILSTIKIDRDFKEWAIDILKREVLSDESKREEEVQKYRDLVEKEKEKKKNLIRMQINGDISREDYEDMRGEIDTQIYTFTRLTEKNFSENEKKLEFLDSILTKAIVWLEEFKNGDIGTKRAMFKNLGYDFTLQDWKLAWILYPWYEVLNNNQNGLIEEDSRFAPTKNSTTERKSSTILGKISQWQGW